VIYICMKFAQVASKNRSGILLKMGFPLIKSRHTL